MSLTIKVAELFDFAVSRNRLVRGSVAGSTIDPTQPALLGRAFAQGMSDLEILNFALTLEHLEAEMYRQMLAKNILTGQELEYFKSFGEHEAAHVTAITQTIQQLGGTPVKARSSYNFPAFNSRGDILSFARTAEELGVGAYQGAASAITNKDVLAAAGSIVQVEARHAAVVRMLIDAAQAVPAATTASLTPAKVLEVVTPILGAE